MRIWCAVASKEERRLDVEELAGDDGAAEEVVEPCPRKTAQNQKCGSGDMAMAKKPLQHLEAGAAGLLLQRGLRELAAGVWVLEICLVIRASLETA
mmetsp:Transcript_21751/g.38861  ORF Transcript_21751/g.38861 Transcript_21751/m.38861 type:complete len:96 (+) Transcript_21751:48-335(+)